jgi:hypothetical protein
MITVIGRTICRKWNVSALPMCPVQRPDAYSDQGLRLIHAQSVCVRSLTGVNIEIWLALMANQRKAKRRLKLKYSLFSKMTKCREMQSIQEHLLKEAGWEILAKWQYSWQASKLKRKQCLMMKWRENLSKREKEEESENEAGESEEKLMKMAVFESNGQPMA